MRASRKLKALARAKNSAHNRAVEDMICIILPSLVDSIQHINKTLRTHAGMIKRLSDK